MLRGGSILVKSVCCPGGFLYLNGQNFLKLWEIFCYYFIEYIMYAFGLHLFSFNAHDSQVWSFDGVAEFLHIFFTALELLTKISSVFSVFSILSLSAEILSPSSSLLECLPLCFLFD
jgi:hypothetical protein